MKRLALCLLAMAVPFTAFAQDGTDGEVNLNAHVMAADFAQFCATFGGEGADCSVLSHAGVAGQAFVFIIASNVDGWTGPGVGNGIGAIQFGITHDLDVLPNGWFPCTDDLQAPQNDANGVWPESGTANALTWPNGCYDPGGENASIGLLLVSDASAGNIQTTIDAREGAGLAAYTDCDAFTWEIVGLNGAAIGDPSSLPFCGPIVPTQEKSWGEIKALF